MDAVPAAVRQARTDMAADFDAIVIGVGISGFYQFYILRELGFKEQVFETGTSFGRRPWYWNRYPARASTRKAIPTGIAVSAAERLIAQHCGLFQKFRQS
jgi:cation diffusion facilitator CzcD-associated flavoprotein CzcO